MMYKSSKPRVLMSQGFLMSGALNLKLHREAPAQTIEDATAGSDHKCEITREYPQLLFIAPPFLLGFPMSFSQIAGRGKPNADSTRSPTFLEDFSTGSQPWHIKLVLSYRATPRNSNYGIFHDFPLQMVKSKADHPLHCLGFPIKPSFFA